MVEEERLKAILESLLFAAAEPVGLSQLVTVIESVARDDIRKALGEMAIAYASGGRGIVLEEVANGYQLRTPKEHALYVRKLLAAKPPRLSRPLLETVAIVAYRQPITRPEIEQLRGVDCGGVIDTLIERRLIQIAGRKEAPGRPIMYTTTRDFLELFGLRDLSGLPDLEELRLIETPREEAVFADEAADSMDTSSGLDGAPEVGSGVDEESAADIAGDPQATQAGRGNESTPGDESTPADDSAAADESASVGESAADAGVGESADAVSDGTGEHHPGSPAVEPEDHD